MTRLECVPNFSEGRKPAVLDALVRAAREVEGACVLDASMDADHNRAVVTVVGEPEPLGEAAFRMVAEAARTIDLRAHQGVHPRMGATDVLPFVPLAPADEGVAVALAHAVGGRIGAELGIPVYFYGAAARSPARRNLPDVRRGGFEGIAAALVHDPSRRPDAGPTDALHPTAGATAVGVRPFLIAFNVELESDDLEAAKAVARAVRESSGGLPGIRALGLYLSERGRVQVSVNLCDPARTGLVEVFSAIEREARARGLAVAGSELIGLAPRFALDAAIAKRVALANFEPARHVLEERLAQCSDPAAPGRTASPPRGTR